MRALPAGRRGALSEAEGAEPPEPTARGDHHRQEAACPVRRRDRGGGAFGACGRQCGAVPAGHGAARAGRRRGGGRDLWRRRVLAAGAAGALSAAGLATSPPAPIAAPCPTRTAAIDARGARSALHGRAAARQGGDARGPGHAMRRCGAPIPAGGRRRGRLRALAPGGAGPLPRSLGARRGGCCATTACSSSNARTR